MRAKQMNITNDKENPKYSKIPSFQFIVAIIYRILKF